MSKDECKQRNQNVVVIHGIQDRDSIPEEDLVTNLYRFNAIPRYILIDKNQRIINTDAARPSELLKSNYLDSLLTE